MSLNRENSALLVVDIQGRLTETVEDATSLHANWLKMIRVARLFELPILVLEQYPEGLGQTITSLKQELGESPVFAKRTFSGYQNTEFKRALKTLNVKHLLVMGIEAHVCVFQTAQDILENETLSLHLLADAVSSRQSIDRTLAIQQLDKAGAIITTVERTAFELMKDSQDELFKAFLRIVK